MSECHECQILQGCRVGIDIHLRKIDLAGIFGGNFIDDGSNHFAGTTPFCPEIDQNRFVGFQYICFKGSIADSFDIVSHDVLEKRGEYQLKKYPKMFIGDIGISVDS